MLITQCPQCNESVRVPDSVKEDTQVQCPWCREAFSGGFVYDQMPPALIVLSGGHEVTDEQAGVLGFTSDAVQDSEHKEHDFSFAGQEDTAPSAEPVSTRAAARRRPQKSSAGEVLKIVGGAVLAFPIAQLILWWLPGDWQRDPLELGPKVGAYVPWVVPANLRPESETEKTADAESNDDTKRKITRGRMQERKGPKGNQGIADANAGRTNPNQATDPDQGTQGQTTPQNNPSNSGAATPDRDDDRKSNGNPETGNSNPGGQPEGPAVGVGVRNAPVYDAADLRVAIDDAEVTSITWEVATTSDATNEAELRQQLIAACSHLGQIVTFVNPASEDLRVEVERIREWMTKIGEKPNLLATVGNAAAARLAEQERKGNGVLIFGTVKRITPHGLLYETQIEVAARDKSTVSVMSLVDPSEVYQLQSRVLILGSIIDDPNKNLAGYSGDPMLVVMGGFPSVVSQ